MGKQFIEKWHIIALFNILTYISFCFKLTISFLYEYNHLSFLLVYIHFSICLYLYIFPYVCICIFSHVCICTFPHMSVYAYFHICISICLYMYIFPYYTYTFICTFINLPVIVIWQMNDMFDTHMVTGYHWVIGHLRFTPLQYTMTPLSFNTFYSHL